MGAGGCGPQLINHSIEVRSQETVSTHVSCHTVSTSPGAPQRRRGSGQLSTCLSAHYGEDSPPWASRLSADRRMDLVASQEDMTASHELIHVCT